MIRILCLCFFLFFTETGFTEPSVLMPYKATYTLYWNDFRVGRSFHTLQKIGSNHYLAEALSVPNISLVPFSSDEKSEFILKNNQVRPIYYQYDNVEKGRRKSGKLWFDWKNKKIITLRGHPYPESNLPDNAQDKITENFQLRLQLDLHNTLSKDPSKTKKTFHYTVVDAKRIRTFTFHWIETETIHTPLGSLKTLKFEHISDNQERKTLFWLAKDLNYLIVKLQQVRKGKIQGESMIETLSPL